MSNQAILVRSADLPMPAPTLGELARQAGTRIDNIGQYLIQYGIAAVLLWMGLLKFAAYEAAAIQPMVAAHPLLSWLYEYFSVAMVSGIIGAAEVSAAILIALRPWSVLAGVAGGAMAIATFAITSSFLALLPPVWQDGSFPFLSVMPGQFLLKDIVLLAAAIWVFGNALKSVRLD